MEEYVGLDVSMKEPSVWIPAQVNRSGAASAHLIPKSPPEPIRKRPPAVDA